MTAAELEELLRPPSDAEVERALARFAADVRAHYGDRLKGIYLFGSRARGDHTPESDADVAVVLSDEGWDFWQEKMTLADLSYKRIVDSGADIEGWPVRETAWLKPATHNNPLLVLAMRRDAKPIERLE